MLISLNGEERQLDGGGSLVEAAALVGVASGDRGVAAAVDGEVIPRGQWATTALDPGARVEIVRAAAGG